MFARNEAPLLICEVDEVLRELPSLNRPFGHDVTHNKPALAPFPVRPAANSNGH